MNSDNLVGITLGNRYDMLEKIGTGGMATVYKAKDTLLNRYVAIKILRDSLEEEKNIVSNFIKEAQSSASLVHNNIVSVYDVGEENGLNYMVMEYVDGITLKEYIKHKGALAWQEACDFAIQIGQGMNEAHSVNIIHRDIKPQNILMTKDKTLKVTDFGIARAVAGETTVVGGGALGSVHYISPEQARGGFTDARSDIYSLGIVLYEMLTGKVPFDGDTAVSVALMHLEKEPVNVKCINLDIPTDLAYVTMKAISKEQRSRYQSVQELVEDLHAVLADEPLPSREDLSEQKHSQQNEDMEATQKITYKEEDIDVPEFVEDDNYYEDRYRVRTKRTVDGKQKTKKQKKEDKMAVVMAISTIVAIALIALGIFFWINMGKEVTVPDFSNMTMEEAEAKANEVGLKISDKVEFSLSDTVAENCVISQDPLPKVTVTKDTEIKLIISLGSSGGNISAPDVTNIKVEEAINKILDAGLQYNVIEEESEKVREGYVIRQTPLAGTKLNKDDEITLHVSKKLEATAKPSENGEQVSVPSIVGLSREEAEAMLKSNGLVLGSITKIASSASEGSVIKQGVEAGKKVIKGYPVSIVVSSGEAKATKAPEKTAEPTQKPESGESNNSNSSNNSSSEKNSESGNKKTSTKTVSFKIPESASDSVNVKIVANGQVVHNESHSKDEGVVSVDISGSGNVSVQAYMDGNLTSEKDISF